MNYSNSFQKEIDVNSMFLSEQHNEAVVRLEHIVRNRWLGVIVGQPGTGKSTVIRRLRQRLDSARFAFCYINDSDLKVKSLYHYMLGDMSIEPAYYLQKAKCQFHDAVLELHGKQCQLVLLIDNAHNLSAKTIHEIRYVLNYDIDSLSPMSVILAGHEDLWSTLRLRHFEAVFQCVNTHYRLKPLDLPQTREYIAHQLSLSGLTQLFPDDCISRIFTVSRGIPRNINTVCLNCLIDIRAKNLQLVDGNVLERVVHDLELSPGGAKL